MRNMTDSRAREEVQSARNFTYLLSGEVDDQNELAAEENNKRTRKPTSKPVKVTRPKPQANGSSMELLDIDKPLLRLKTPTEMVQAGLDHEVKAHPTSKISKAKVVKTLTSGMLAPATALGRVLYRAAQLSEAMECYQEEQLLKEFLHSNPPYHPRRTLDQSYYWTLQSTKKRDRDQVIYRGTAPKKDVMHKFHCKTEKDDPPCRQCYDDIRKVPRVIMVDQLWLWILDGSKLCKLSASSLSVLSVQLPSHSDEGDLDTHFVIFGSISSLIIVDLHSPHSTTRFSELTNFRRYHYYKLPKTLWQKQARSIGCA
jgi:hypothetical protein